MNTIAFSYSGLGNRIKKSCTHSPYSYYALDPNGNTLAMYTKEVGGSYELEELYTYGSSRLGTVKHRNNASLGHSALEAVESFLEYGTAGNGSSLGDVCYTEPISRAKFLGYKTYELSNHLGNVLSVVQDYKQHRLNPQNPSEAWNYMPICNSFNDYYPFGMVMPGRVFTGSENYRFGFNGMEKDDEVKGNGNSLDFGARIYDPRIGRWLSMDPLARKYPSLSDYSFVGNSPMVLVDPTGGEIEPASNLSEKNRARVISAIKKVEDSRPKLYTMMQTLRYHPEIGFFSDLDKTSYSEEQFEKMKDQSVSIIIHVTIDNIDGFKDIEERSELMKAGTTINNVSTEHIDGNTRSSGDWQVTGGFDGRTMVYPLNDNEGEPIFLEFVDPNQDFSGFKTIFKVSARALSSGNEYHLLITLDDFTSTKKAQMKTNGGGDFEILCHEFGHIEGDIQNPQHAAYDKAHPEEEGHGSGQGGTAIDRVIKDID